MISRLTNGLSFKLSTDSWLRWRVRLTQSPSACPSNIAPTSPMIAAALGKTRATSVRRLTTVQVESEMKMK